MEVGNMDADEGRALARFEKLVEEIYAGENPPEAAFEMWVNLCHILVQQGWTLERLSENLILHVQLETSKGLA
jgi:hypothetical protein